MDVTEWMISFKMKNPGMWQNDFFKEKAMDRMIFYNENPKDVTELMISF